MKDPRLLLLLFCSCSVAALLNTSYPGSDTPIEARTLDEQYAASQAEAGELTVLWGGDAVSQGESTISAWNQRFPKVKLNLTVDLSKYHDSRVDREYAKTQKDGADVAVLQTLQDFDRWKRQGRLMPYKPPTWDKIYPNEKDADGAFIGVYFYQFGNLIYDTNVLNDSEVPTSYADFLKPSWKNKLVLTYPDDDDAIAYLFSIIINKYGSPWFESLAQQEVKWVRGTGTPAALLTSSNSTSAISFTTNLINSTNLASKDASDPHMAWGQTGAIFASTERPESAKLFMSWLMSDEHQLQLAESGIFLTRSGVANVTQNIWDDKSVAATQFGKFMTNREDVERWRFQYETTLGTAQGKSPLTYGI